MPPKRNVLGAMFDVRPIKESGGLDLEKVTKHSLKLNLRHAITAKVVSSRRISDDFFDLDATLTSNFIEHGIAEYISKLEPTTLEIEPVKDSRDQTAVWSKKREIEDFKPEAGTPATRGKILQEIEEIVSSPMNVTAEIVKFGGKLNFQALKKPAPKSVEHFPYWLVTPDPEKITEPLEAGPKTVDSLTDWWTNIPKINKDPTLTATELVSSKDSFDVERSDDELETVTTASTRRPWPSSVGDKYKIAANKSRRLFEVQPRTAREKIRFRAPIDLFGRKAWVTGVAIVLVFVGFKFLSQSEISIKNNITQNGKNAVENLMEARENLLGFDFAAAANNFALAQDDFSKAGSRLDKVGAVFTPLLRYIPGLNKIAAANNLVVAGQNISQAGSDLSSALDDLTKVQLNSFIDSENGGGQQSLYELLKALREVLASSQSKVNKASSLLASVNESLLPEDKRDLFVLFKDKLPELAAFFNKSNDSLNILIDLVGEKGTKTYLMLLQNNTELRATGGFPGSYALITIQDGYIKEIKIDDTYNPDGQLHDNLIPPKPLQHITPTWGMRDANWFANFPTSAQKVINSYSKSTGMIVDGILTLTPDVITDILAGIGPIEMPDYGVTLNADNFLPEIQEEVEYGEDKADNRPKKILMDFQPKFLAKLGEQDKANLVKISQVLTTAFQQKRILAYFLNKDAQELAIIKNFGGELKNPKGDYLQVNISNIKGFKTDLVTKTALDLNTNIDSQSTADHELAVTRTHNGGNLDQKFYNQPNPAYIRVYAPQGAEFESITGNTWATYEPLVDYSQSIFKSDPDLAAIEERTRNPVFAVDVFEESGKTVFGFWLVVNPGKSQTVTLKYKEPNAYENNKYNLYIQKQSGTQNITFDVNIHFPDSTKITSDFPSDLKSNQNTATLTSNLDLDIPIEIQTE